MARLLMNKRTVRDAGWGKMRWKKPERVSQTEVATLWNPFRGTGLWLHPTQRALRDAGLWDVTPSA